MGDTAVKEEINAIIVELEALKQEYERIRENTHCRRSETSECDECIADCKLKTRLATVDTVMSIVRKYM